MLFNSYIFILFFLPVTLMLYYGLNALRKENIAKMALIGMSLWFYAYFHVSYLLLISTSILFNYACSKILIKTKNNLIKKFFLTSGILVNIGIIVYFKYFDFLIDSINKICGQAFECNKSIICTPKNH